MLATLDTPSAVKAPTVSPSEASTSASEAAIEPVAAEPSMSVCSFTCPAALKAAAPWMAALMADRKSACVFSVPAKVTGYVTPPITTFRVCPAVTAT